MPHADAGHDKPRRQWAPDARALSVVGDRWLMVIVRDLASGPLRLDALRRWLPGVSAGALEARLARMAEEGLLIRRRHRSLPPRVDLELTERGHALVDVIAELARWELRTHWSQPRGDEWVDIAACFRLAPLLRPPGQDDLPDGELALTIANDNGGAIDHHTYVRHEGRTKLEHRQATDPAATITGSQDAWIQALSPEGNHTGVHITGDTAAAQDFLGLFHA